MILQPCATPSRNSAAGEILEALAAALLLAGLTGHSLGNDALPAFVDEPAVIEFARDLEQRHGFNTAELLGQFARTQPNARVLQLIQPPSSPQQRSWERYRPRFLNERRIEGGVRFWQENQDTLARARTFYGVPEEVIVAIIGVETEYGRNTGGFSVLEALATLAFHYPRRAEFFRTELEQFLLLARENQLDPLAVKGSFAGAIGIPQFMPGSQRRYAIDFDGDQRVDLSGSVDDAIGSVARFLEQHGWQSGQPVAVPAAVVGEPEADCWQPASGPACALINWPARASSPPPRRRQRSPWSIWFHPARRRSTGSASTIST
jgi:membrane-bound lytic murein transglycosylase B